MPALRMGGTVTDAGEVPMSAVRSYGSRTTAKMVSTLNDRRKAAAHAATSLREEFIEAATTVDMSDLVDDDGGQGQDTEDVLMLAERVELHIAEIEAALERAARGTYGICVGCSRRIPLARLEALPSTPWCIECSLRASGH